MAARVAVAAVWWYEGLWCKVLRGDPHEWSIVAAVPWLPAAWVATAVVGIGLAEIALGAWVLSGVRARLAAVVQTVVLIAFNVGGLFFAGEHITAPGRLVTQNAVLLATVWWLCERPMWRLAGD